MADDTAAQQRCGVIRQTAPRVGHLMQPLLSFIVAAVVLLASVSSPAAQSGERSPFDLNPKCRERDAKPEDCVIDDGPPQQYRRVRPQQPPAKPVTPPPPPKPQEPILKR